MNASTDGKTYAALGVTEWEVYSVLNGPIITSKTNQVLISSKKGLQNTIINIEGKNIPEEGANISIEPLLPGITLSTNHISKSDLENGVTLEISYDSTVHDIKTSVSDIVIKSGDYTLDIPVMLSLDEGFNEEDGNLVFDPCFYSLERLSTWGIAPEIVNIADGYNVKSGATCLKLNGERSGIELKNNIFLMSGEYKISGWIKSNGTMETGIYSSDPKASFSSSDTNVINQGNSINFRIPNTKNEWQYFEYTFVVNKDVLGGAWVNNDRNSTATTAFLDNFQIYPTEYPFDNSEISTYKDYNITPISFTDVHFTDNFWLPRIEQNQSVTIPIALQQCESTGRIANFEKAAAILRGENIGYFDPSALTFDDTDIYKILEGMSYSIQTRPNEEINKKMDELINLISSAQEPDGYLYTARTAGEPGNYHVWVGKNRWEADPELSHELYNCGHLYEAAYAHYNATGKKTLLNIAIKNADLLVRDFLDNRLAYEPGHQIVEMGLVKMYRATGNKRYLELAKYFLDLRGTKGVKRAEYSQSHRPVVIQDEAVGHAVRAAYMYSGMADIAALTDNKDYLNAIDKIWNNVIGKKYYITGGIGAVHDGEAFGANYELPNKTAYCETCAAIANVYWNWRMFLLHGESKYYDVLERTLYNGLISGIGMDGKTFFYPNPLESDGKYKFNFGNTIGRQEWFGCACCPSNLCRFIASVSGYVYAKKGDCIYVNLFAQSNSEIKMEDDNIVKLKQTTEYPWDGKIRINVESEKNSNFKLRIRIPGWAKNEPVPSDLYAYVNSEIKPTIIKVNGETLEYNIGSDGYVLIDRTWNKGDVIEILLPMEIHKIKSHDNVTENKNKIALERGPIVYCIESCDNQSNIFLSAIEDTSKISVINYTINKNELKALEINGKQSSIEDIYKTKLTAIPYYAWANRGISQMAVWLNTNAYSLNQYKFNANDWEAVPGRSNILVNNEKNTINVTGQGDFDIALNLAVNNKYSLNASQKYLLIKGKNLSLEKNKNALWWLIGNNHESTELPQLTLRDSDYDYILWDITETIFKNDWPSKGDFNINSNNKWNTCFGLTSVSDNQTSEIYDISFYSLRDLVEKYPIFKNNIDLIELNENVSYYPIDGTHNVYLNRHFESNKWNSLCLPFDLNKDELIMNKIYEVRLLESVKEYKGKTILNFSEPLNNIEAGKPYLIKVKDEISGISAYNTELPDIKTTTIEVDNVIKMKGTFIPTTITGNNYFINNNYFYRAAEQNISIKAYRAFINVEDHNVSNNNVLYICLDGVITNINSLYNNENDNKPVKVYSLEGALIKSNVNKKDALNGLKKGFYIVNGKKIIK